MLTSHSAASTYFVGIACANTKKIELAHVDLTDLPYATSRIVTSGATVTRTKDTLGWLNDGANGYHVINATRGTIFIVVESTFITTELPTGLQFTLFNVKYDANNEFRLDYYESGGTYRWRWRIRRSGTNYDSEYAQNLTIDQVVTLAVRYTSGSAEEDLAAYTSSLFVDKALRSSINYVGAITESSGKTFRFGHDDAVANHASFALRYLKTTATVFSDLEVIALM
jgi:hypothetical protein